MGIGKSKKDVEDVFIMLAKLILWFEKIKILMKKFERMSNCQYEGCQFNHVPIFMEFWHRGDAMPSFPRTHEKLHLQVLSIFTGLGIAGVSASVLTSILPETLEDLLALGLCTAGGYVLFYSFAKVDNFAFVVEKFRDSFSSFLFFFRRAECCLEQLLSFFGVLFCDSKL